MAAGQTAQCGSQPGGHKFDESVHIGVPGSFALGQSGRVQVIKTENATC